MKYVLDFRLEKETKGAVQYKEYAQGNKIDQQAAVVGTLYVRKSALDGRIPAELRVTVETIVL